jgi:hypothetical protein
VSALKWTGVLLLATGLAGLPVAIWVSERWGLIFATLGTLGCVVLGAAYAGSRAKSEPEDADR